MKRAAQGDLPAGDFAAWLVETREVQLAKGGASVPCGECIGCCTSSYFIHVGPGEYETLRAIPSALLFPAPGLPEGHMLLGYDEMGRCPMLVESRCSIYPNRPQTCRSFDCRVFSAAGLAAGGSDKTVIDERVRRWRFNYPREIDRTAQAAVETAAAFLREHAARFPAAFVPGNPAQVAVLAIKVYEVFLDGARAATDEAVIRAVIEKAREFDSRTVGRG